MSGTDRYVVKRGRDWAVKKAGKTTPEGVYQRQGDAERAAKRTVRGLGGGEVRIQGWDGRWRDSDTVPPGNDPHPPWDKRH